MHLSRDPRIRPFAWLAGAAASALLSSWLVFYVDAKFIGRSDDRVGLLYLAMLPWMLGAMLCSAISAASLSKKLHRPVTNSDRWLMRISYILLYIAWGPITATITLPLLRWITGTF